jgi:hypothetical protein
MPSMRTEITASGASSWNSRMMPQLPRHRPRPAAIRVDRIAPQPNRIDALDEFGRIVSLRDEMNGVVAVGEWPRAIADADPVRHEERLAILAPAAQLPDEIRCYAPPSPRTASPSQSDPGTPLWGTSGRSRAGRATPGSAAAAPSPRAGACCRSAVLRRRLIRRSGSRRALTPYRTRHRQQRRPGAGTGEFPDEPIGAGGGLRFVSACRCRCPRMAGALLAIPRRFVASLA